MAENEKIVSVESGNSKAPLGKRAGAALKEWWRKKIVGLKRKPQSIPLFVLAVTTVYFMLVLFVISQAIKASYTDPHTAATGICIFVTTLLSLLVLVSLMNAFPKRKKPNVFFIVLVFAMVAAMIVCDVVYYVQMNACLENILNPETSDMFKTVSAAQPYVIVHIILLGVSAVIFALLPVYSRLIKKINTSVVLESATENMQGNIDIQED